MKYGRFARCPVRPESFRPDRESFRPEYEVVSPGLRVHTYRYVRGRLFKNEEYSHTIFVCLFVLDSSLDRSEKTLELDLILNPQAKQLHAPGESTLSPGETTTGEQDIRRKDLLPPKNTTQCPRPGLEPGALTPSLQSQAS